MNHRTLEEYKEEVFDKLDDKTKLEWMYQMSMQLCNVAEYIKERKEFHDLWHKQVYENLLKMLGSDDNE